MKIEPEIRVTADGSHTLFVPGLNEHYHSVNGAVIESKHVYIDAALNICGKEEINVLEFGFGTGLNALLTACEAENSGRRICYSTIEKYPLSPETYSLLNYGDLLSGSGSSLFKKIHACEWDQMTVLTPYFSIHKIHSGFSRFIPEKKYDVVFYDAFAPDKQPGVWLPEIFERLYFNMNAGGILTTYCAKGMIRRMMMAAGFDVERIPGPPGKRQMLRARKICDK